MSVLKRIKYVAIGLGSAIALLAVWGLIEPRLLNTKEETATIPNLPADWEGKQIVQISDFQIGMWADNPGTARRSVEQAIEANPAAVLVSGDFIYHAGSDPTKEIETAVSIVEPLVDAGIPTYAVLGNHDYGMSSKTADPREQLASTLTAELEAAGIVVLQNESTQMQLADGGEPLYLVAVGSLWANRDDADAALAEVPESSPRVVLMHNPDSFERFPPNTAPLAVAGHTHGGQMRIPNSPQWSWLKFTQGDEVTADGWIQDYGQAGNNLYVNVGIGMSIIPVRIFCPPEMTLFTLASGDSET
ncbi:Ser/Thr protein phosphatase family protein [Synechococcus sp. PCC 7335]|uniref:metallophosphoesterase n=1 Tax=Synechococcus sp. (strain ATCC 29403 / PCC 7335) TaxID=91464 RepID=UPI00017EC3EA|nr:metallophosphoesterase [Synechococcus sp. PCC 7335]EDX86038.1 Ser/Thr protein phosphatase family protein [Synechococcus sp. PCC 7335]